MEAGEHRAGQAGGPGPHLGEIETHEGKGDQCRGQDRQEGALHSCGPLLTGLWHLKRVRARSLCPRPGDRRGPGDRVAVGKRQVGLPGTWQVIRLQRPTTDGQGSEVGPAPLPPLHTDPVASITPSLRALILPHKQEGKWGAVWEGVSCSHPSGAERTPVPFEELSWGAHWCAWAGSSGEAAPAGGSL